MLRGQFDRSQKPDDTSNTPHYFLPNALPREPTLTDEEWQHDIELRDNDQDPPSYGSQYQGSSGHHQHLTPSSSRQSKSEPFSPLPTTHEELRQRLEAAAVSERQILAVLYSQTLDFASPTYRQPTDTDAKPKAVLVKSAKANQAAESMSKDADRPAVTFVKAKNEPFVAHDCDDYPFNLESKDYVKLDICYRNDDTSILVPAGSSPDARPMYTADYHKKGFIQLFSHSSRTEVSKSAEPIAKIKYGSNWHPLVDLTIHGNDILTYFHEPHVWDRDNLFGIIPVTGKKPPRLEHPCWVQDRKEASTIGQKDKSENCDYHLMGHLEGDMTAAVYEIISQKVREGKIQIPMVRVRDPRALDAIVAMALASLEWHRKRLKQGRIQLS